MIKPTQKIVINACYGGFGLSAKAMARWAELENKPCFFFTQAGFLGPYVSTPIDDLDGKSRMFFAFDIPNPNEILVNTDDWNLMSSDEKELANKLYSDHVFSYHDLQRDDPLLIKIVEELGAEANGNYASLKVVEIPNDVTWEIDEYDGWETIRESHRTWG